uniref:Carotenoid cleavage dioxygenase 4, chloroplastic n=1 Tax=Nelumbo nucifera TaxID=4432 RepID=A0A822ZJW0_NELNU|nr:TPA_asm: hypothetical protein HUJ06_001526 [Nelumbo nucifera]
MVALDSPLSTPLHHHSRSKSRCIKQKKTNYYWTELSAKSLSLQATNSSLIKTLFMPPHHSSVDPKQILTGNFAPVDEIPPTECPVVDGELPPSLNGVYIRNGPNPQHQPHGPYHQFEGDGMLHSLRISHGCATFCSRYVKTYKYSLEQKLGSPAFPNFLSGFYSFADIARCAAFIGRIVTGEIKPRKGFGSANTSLTFFANKIFALCESDLPYVIHLTPEGEMFAFRCSLVVPPFLTLFHFDVNGTKVSNLPIFSVQRPTFIHDFAITKRYTVFAETQLVMKPIKLVMARGTPLDFDPDKVPRIGVIPRYATSESEIRWFSVPGFNAMHIINAWGEDHDENVINLLATNGLSIEHFFHELETVHFSVEKVRIDMRDGSVSRATLSPTSLEFGRINLTYVGRKSRYAYFGVADQVPKMSGVVKLDLELGREVSSRFYEPGCFGGEPFFVARDVSVPDDQLDEDDGYLVSYVHDESTGESKFMVMDAKSPNLDVVAAVKLPQRVPYGFHGHFVREKDLTEN